MGAKAYVKAHAGPLPKISNRCNRDGGPEPPVGIRVSEAMYDDFEKIAADVRRINPEYPFEVSVCPPSPRPKQASNVDADVFAMEGVPTYGFVEEDIKGYDFDYDEIWHTERDLYTKNIPEYQEHAAVVTAVMALGVANLDKLLPREGVYSD